MRRPLSARRQEALSRATGISSEVMVVVEAAVAILLRPVAAGPAESLSAVGALREVIEGAMPLSRLDPERE